MGLEEYAECDGQVRFSAVRTIDGHQCPLFFPRLRRKEGYSPSTSAMEYRPGSRPTTNLAAISAP